MQCIWCRNRCVSFLSSSRRGGAYFSSVPPPPSGEGGDVAKGEPGPTPGKQKRRKPTGLLPALASLFYDPSTPRMAIVMRTDLGMSKGKLCAQAAHGALSAYRQALEGSGEQRGNARAWEGGGQTKVVLRVDSEAGLLALREAGRAKGLPMGLVRDAGRTEVAPGTITCLALGPGSPKDMGEVTGHLKLL